MLERNPDLLYNVKISALITAQYVYSLQPK